MQHTGTCYGEKKQSCGSIHLKVSNEVYHWPNLKTVLMIEKTIHDAGSPLSIEGLKRVLPVKIMDQTLRLILAYLEDRGSIMIGKKGIVWIENRDPKFLKLIGKGKRIEL
jgi:hypothetical protein